MLSQMMFQSVLLLLYCFCGCLGDGSIYAHWSSIFIYCSYLNVSLLIIPVPTAVWSDNIFLKSEKRDLATGKSEGSTSSNSERTCCFRKHYLGPSHFINGKQRLVLCWQVNFPTLPPACWGVWEYPCMGKIQQTWFDLSCLRWQDQANLCFLDP